MQAHASLTGADLHVPGYVQATDPGAVGAGKLWVDTSSGSGGWALKIRNTGDTAWETIVSATTLPANGSGSPEGVVTRTTGATYLDVASDPPSLWVKYSGTGNTGWRQLIA